MSDHSTEGEFDFDMEDIDEAIVHSIPSKQEQEEQDLTGSLQTYQAIESNFNLNQSEISSKEEDSKYSNFDPEQILKQANALLQDKQQQKGSQAQQSQKKNKQQAEKQSRQKRSPFEMIAQSTKSSQSSISQSKIITPANILQNQNTEVIQNQYIPQTQAIPSKAKENLMSLDEIIEKQMKKRVQVDIKKIDYQPVPISKTLKKESQNNKAKDFVKQNKQKIQKKAKPNLQNSKEFQDRESKKELIVSQLVSAGSLDSFTQITQSYQAAKINEANDLYNKKINDTLSQNTNKLVISQNLEKSLGKSKASPKQALHQPQNSQNSQNSQSSIIKDKKTQKNNNKNFKIEEILEQQEDTSRSKSAVPAKRLQDYRKNVELKTQLLKEKLEQEKLKECTFAPQLQTHKEGKQESNPRPLKEFLQSQQLYQKQVQEKIQQKQEEKQAFLMGQAEQQKQFVCDGSKKILSQKYQPDIPAFKRLYNQHELRKQKTEILKNEIENQERTETFTPKITNKSKMIIRDKSVDDILYEDARRRAKTPVQGRRGEDSKDQKSNNYQVSSKSNQLLRERLEQELSYYYEQLILSFGSDEKLNYIGLQKLLQEMYFIEGDMNSPIYSEEKQLTKIMWDEIGEETDGVAIQPLKEFLFAILGYKRNNQIGNQVENNSGNVSPNQQSQWTSFSIMTSNSRIHTPQDISRSTTPLPFGARQKLYGFFEGYKYVLTGKGIQKLHRDFKQFLTTRNNSTQKSNQNPTFKSQVKEVPTFRPQILRQKKEDKKQFTTEEDAKRHVQQLMASQVKKEVKLQKHKQLIEEQEMEKFTFHPNIDKSQANHNVSTLKDTSYVRSKTPDWSQNQPNKHEELYSLHQQKLCNIKEKQKEAQQYISPNCTFKPDTMASKQSKILKEKKQKKDYAKGTQQTIERMRQARNQRELMTKVKERGIPFMGNKTWDLVKNQVGSPQQITQQQDALQNKAKQISSQLQKNQINQKKSGNTQRQEEQVSSLQRTKSDKIFENRKSQLTQDEENSQEERQQFQNKEEEDSEDGSQQEDKQDSEEEDEDEDEEQEKSEEQEDEEDEEESEQESGSEEPIMYVDINLGPNRKERITIYEGNTAQQLASEFIKKHKLKAELMPKLVNMLKSKMQELDEKVL